MTTMLSTNAVYLQGREGTQKAQAETWAFFVSKDGTARLSALAVTAEVKRIPADRRFTFKAIYYAIDEDTSSVTAAGASVDVCPDTRAASSCLRCPSD